MPTEGPILIRVTASGIPSPQGDLPRLQVDLGYDGGAKARPVKMVAALDVDAATDTPNVYEFHVRAENFPLQTPAYEILRNGRHLSKATSRGEIRGEDHQLTCPTFEPGLDHAKAPSLQTRPQIPSFFEVKLLLLSHPSCSMVQIV